MKTKVITLFMMVMVLSAVMVAPASAYGKQKADVYGPMGCMTSEAHCEDFGDATLKRRANRVVLNLKTKGLEAGAAYTVWFVIFNHPEFCDGACDGSDLSNPAVGGSVLWGGGQLADETGRAKFRVTLNEGMAPGEVISGPGLLDAQTAEVHAVVRTHGQPIPGALYDQLFTLAGGCDVNACANIQAAVFEAD